MADGVDPPLLSSASNGYDTSQFRDNLHPSQATQIQKRTTMAKKSKADRTDPKKNKSLAIRSVVTKMPNAKAKEIVAAVQTEYGHKVTPTLVYLVKSKSNMKADRRARKPDGGGVKAPMNSAATWVDAIRLAKQLSKATGSVDNAKAILKAVDG